MSEVKEAERIASVIEELNRYLLPKEEIRTEYNVRTKYEYIDVYNRIKDAYGSYETKLGELCWSTENKEMNYSAYCTCCEKKVDLKVDFLFSHLLPGTNNMTPLWRERLVCPHCHLNNRMRYFYGKIKELYRPGLKVYICEQVTAMFSALKKYIPDLAGSEYLNDNWESGRTERGILHQDLMNLSFADEAFDLVASQDVLEHVSDYRKAFTEMYRILRKQGIAIFTVPFSCFGDKTDNLAIVEDGKTIFLKDPIYHGNPLSEEGSLVYNIFSWDMLDSLKSCGFSDAYLQTYYSVENGNLGILPMVIIAKKS